VILPHQWRHRRSPSSDHAATSLMEQATRLNKSSNSYGRLERHLSQSVSDELTLGAVDSLK
jgi:hypothetical protein